MSGPNLPRAGNSVTDIDGRAFRSLLNAALAWLDRHHEIVNALNVFPVPDGDTGTNMLLTMRSACQEITDENMGSVGEIARTAAHGALMGARGNSGVILSQILRGMARKLDGESLLTGRHLAAALSEGSRIAYKGVNKPVEGTILTVVREAAGAAESAAALDDELSFVLDRTVRAAADAVANTPKLLPILAQTGKVDSGGKGLFFILEGMYRALLGEAVETEEEQPEAAVTTGGARPAKGHRALPSLVYGFDVQFLVEGPDLDVESIHRSISSMGDYPLVEGDRNLVKVHVHVPDPGRVLSYAVSLGFVTDVVVENMDDMSIPDMPAGYDPLPPRFGEDQGPSLPGSALRGEKAQRSGLEPGEGRVAPGAAGGRGGGTATQGAQGGGSGRRGSTGPGQSGYQAEGTAPGDLPPAEAALLSALAEANVGPAEGPGVVAVAPGAGLAEVFKSLGAHSVVSGGQTMNPSTQDLLQAIQALPYREVIVLPNNGNVIMTAQQAQALSDRPVAVVPSKSIPQGISALLALNAHADLEHNAETMTAALGNVETGEVTMAVQDAAFDGIHVRAGDIIGLHNDTLTASGRTPEDVVRELLAQMGAGDLEIITLYYGEPVTAGQAESLRQELHASYPDQEIEMVDGGQPFYHYIISAE